MTKRAVAGKKFGGFGDIDGAQDAGFDSAFLEIFLDKQGIDNRCHHADGVSGRPVDAFRARPAKDISSADDDAHFNARVMDFLDFIGDLIDFGGVKTEAALRGERFTRKFQEYPFINRAHCLLLLGPKFITGK